MFSHFYDFNMKNSFNSYIYFGMTVYAPYFRKIIVQINYS